ncbi:outer membrane protein [Chitinophaga sp.]|uniref:outer membrane protein n=1 Tax=Chitinophaga sp. TaxID=1869181 RepID=UPI002F94495F
MKLLFLVTMLTISMQIASAQQQTTPHKFRINALAGYVFDDSFDSYYDANSYYNGVLQGGFQWGVGLEYMVRDVYGVELQYLRQDTKGPVTYFQNGVKNTNFDLAVNYILLSGNRYFKLNSPLTPYAGIMAGVGILNIDNPDNGRSSNATKFSWGVKGGTNINVSSRFAFKLQAQLLSAVQGAGGGVYFGTGGLSTGLSTYSTILQFGFSGGIAVSF